MTRDVDGFSVNAEQLARKAGDFEPLVGRLSGIHTSLTDALSAEGDCWGADDVGQSFSSVHATPATSTLDSLSGLPDLLGSVGIRLTDSAVTYQGAEDLAGDHLRATDQ